MPKIKITWKPNKCGYTLHAAGAGGRIAHVWPTANGWWYQTSKEASIHGPVESLNEAKSEVEFIYKEVFNAARN